ASGRGNIGPTVGYPQQGSQMYTVPAAGSHGSAPAELTAQQLAAPDGARTQLPVMQQPSMHPQYGHPETRNPTPEEIAGHVLRTADSYGTGSSVTRQTMPAGFSDAAAAQSGQGVGSLMGTAPNNFGILGWDTPGMNSVQPNNTATPVRTATATSGQTAGMSGGIRQTGHLMAPASQTGLQNMQQQSGYQQTLDEMTRLPGGSFPARAR
ncbi:MAG: hypothetical protein KDA85_02930, partial [Planctomycetaceae bacterium]|nr:hypothetical protein [Planctomycetaceae bacterium]